MVDFDDPNSERTGKNTKIIAEIVNTVSDDEAISQQTLCGKRRKDGLQWTFREVFELDDGQTEEFVVNNTTSEDTLIVSDSLIDPSEEISGESRTNVDVDSTGTDFNFRNNLITNPLNSEIDFVVEYGGSYSGGNSTLDIKGLPGGQGVGSSTAGGETVCCDVYNIEPGANIYYQVESEEDGNIIVVDFTIGI